LAVRDNFRIEELRRRIQNDPASIAFAQLAEEYRRAGRHGQAIDVCRAGLLRHPGYLSARVTLGRCLIATEELDGALIEFTRVLEAAPENLAAIRGLAEVYRRRGELSEALEQYRVAFELAQHDSDLAEVVRDITRELEAPTAPVGGRIGTPEENARPVPELETLPRPADIPPQAPAAAVQPHALPEMSDGEAERVLLLLERWLDAIVAERQRRSGTSA
jgi:tetratricopeptide (TPR) repeat protein